MICRNRWGSNEDDETRIKYTEELVACYWALMQRLAKKANVLLTNRPTDQQANGPTEWRIEWRARDYEDRKV